MFSQIKLQMPNLEQSWWYLHFSPLGLTRWLVIVTTPSPPQPYPACGAITLIIIELSLHTNLNSILKIFDVHGLEM